MDEEKEGGAKIRKEGLTWTIRKEGRQEGSKKECRGSESGRVGGRGKKDGRKGGRKEEPVERGVQRGSLRGVTAKVWLGTLARQVGSARWYPSQGAWRSLGTQMILTFPSRVNPSLGRARDSLQVTGYRERSQQRHGPLVRGLVSRSQRPLVP